MSFFRSLKCATGFHDWSDWTRKVSGTCIQRRTCKGCGANGTQEEHDWTKYEYVSEHSCEQQKYCRHCERREKRAPITHAWTQTDWAYFNTESCEQLRKCPRCADEERRTTHLWGAWQNESPASETLVRFCRRCAEGKEIQEPRPIICMPKEDIGFHFVTVSQMQSLAPSWRDDSMLLGMAQAIELSQRQHGCRIEIGHRPGSGSADYSYLAWDWDDSAGKYAVVRWDGRKWTK
jgi:hypothetical protein